MSETNTLTVKAKKENLPQVLTHVERILTEAGASLRVLHQVLVAAEEVYINIASYAYEKGTGNAVIRIKVDGGTAEIEFRDRGFPFDPLDKADPDVTLSADERRIGGLGIYMVKKTMDEVWYRCENGENILTIRKKLQ